jgi:prepilin-type processing-associated H-X9-DG protein/prepilin-type N-terminal cleavage/methylation domain-containing protein
MRLRRAFAFVEAPGANKPRSAAFTLIELLVVVAIIVLLIALLVPSLKNARELARRLPCINNEKGMGRAVQTYFTSNYEYLPPLKVWIGGDGNLCWWWQDFIQPYFDADAIRSTTWNYWGESIACQPADGNCDRNMPRYRYSRRMDCPSVPNVGESEYVWSCAVNPYGNYNTDYYLIWLQNWVNPASNSDNSVSPLPANQEIGSGWTKTAKNPVKFSRFKNTGQICIVLEPNPMYWNFHYFGWDYQRVAVAQAAPHLGTCNALFLDGHVEQFTRNFLVTWDSSKNYPFNGP